MSLDAIKYMFSTADGVYKVSALSLYGLYDVPDVFGEKEEMNSFEGRKNGCYMATELR